MKFVKFIASCRWFIVYWERSMKHIANIVLAFCVAVVALHVWGALNPSHYNWGVHFYAFLNPAALWISVILTLAMCIPAVQSRVVPFLSRILELLGKLPAPLPFMLVASAVIAC